MVQVDWLNGDLRLDEAGGVQGFTRLPAAGHARAGNDLRRRRRELGVQAPERAAGERWRGTVAGDIAMPGTHHFSVLDGLAVPSSALFAGARRLMQARPMKEFLSPAAYIDSDHPAVVAFARENAKGGTPLERAVSLYYAVRDGIRYNPFLDFSNDAAFRASQCIASGEGFCVGKAALLAACARADGIPARVGFADVKNHLTTPALRERMGSDLFVYHGYTELFLEGKWVKATPAFNVELCRRFKVRPLDFDGREDSIFHAFDEKILAAIWNTCATAAVMPMCRLPRSCRCSARSTRLPSGQGNHQGKFRLTPRELLEASFRAAVAAADPLLVVPRICRSRPRGARWCSRRARPPPPWRSRWKTTGPPTRSCSASR